MVTTFKFLWPWGKQSLYFFIILSILSQSYCSWHGTARARRKNMVPLSLLLGSNSWKMRKHFSGCLGTLEQVCFWFPLPQGKSQKPLETCNSKQKILLNVFREKKLRLSLGEVLTCLTFGRKFFFQREFFDCKTIFFNKKLTICHSLLGFLFMFSGEEGGFIFVYTSLGVHVNWEYVGITSLQGDDGITLDNSFLFAIIMRIWRELNRNYFEWYEGVKCYRVELIRSDTFVGVLFHYEI